MKSKANSGFIKEIPKAKAEPSKSKAFVYPRAIVKPTADANATPYRIKEHKASKQPNKITSMAAKLGKK